MTEDPGVRDLDDHFVVGARSMAVAFGLHAVSELFQDS
jgi:hypothetical protein